MNNLNSNELTNIQQTGQNLIDSAITDFATPETIIEFKLLIETLCKKQEHVPMEIEKIVHRSMKKKFSNNIQAAAVIAADFCPFFYVIKGKEAKFALKCLDTLNDAMADEFCLILEEAKAPIPSWNILQLLLSVGKEIEISRKDFPKSSFLSKIILGKNYKELVNFFDRDFCDELDKVITEK